MDGMVCVKHVGGNVFRVKREHAFKLINDAPKEWSYSSKEAWKAQGRKYL